MTAKNGTKGFEVPEPGHVRLKFEDDWLGAEVVCRRSVPFGTALDFSAISGIVLKDAGPDEVTRIRQAFQDFGNEVLVEWNLTKGGVARPADGVGMMGLTMDAAMKLVSAWGDAVKELATPLAEPD